MKPQSGIRLLLNHEMHDHSQDVLRLLQSSDRFECMVAFAKMSGWRKIEAPLKAALARGMNARIAVGLSFFLTDPKVLQLLADLVDRHSLQLFLSQSDKTFHPKIYAFGQAQKGSLIVGSANLTGGGLSDNHEASLLVSGRSSVLIDPVIQHFDDLIKEKAIVSATSLLIRDYARKYAVHSASRRIAERLANNPELNQDHDFFSNILVVMREDRSVRGLDAQMAERRANIAAARRILKQIASTKRQAAGTFENSLNRLIAHLHSGGLHRNKTGIIGRPSAFSGAIRAIINLGKSSPEVAFALLESHFSKIPGAGINLLTEILHTIDSKRFMVMNGNSVQGLGHAGLGRYPARPSKQNLSARRYAEYCRDAAKIRKSLGLRDFTELDALFNYIYWNEAERAETDTGS